MDGIERADRLDGEGPRDACEDLVGDGNDGAAPLERLKCAARCPLLPKGDAAGHPGPDDGSEALRERERRRHTPSLRPHLRSGRRIVFEQRGEQCARFHVAHDVRACPAGGRAGGPRAPSAG